MESTSTPPPPLLSNVTSPASPSPPLSPTASPSLAGNGTAQQAAVPSPGLSRPMLTALGVGVGIGGLVVVLAVGVFVLLRHRRKRKRLDDCFHASSQQWQQNAPPSDNLVSQLHKPAVPLDVAAESESQQSPTSFIIPISTSDNGGSEKPVSGESLGFSKSTFSYEELTRATDNFSSANLLGQGGFGYVHKGVLPNGKEVAVKQLKSGSGQGEREFQAEVGTISRVHHRHLVSLVGHCISGDQRLLVYEYVPNNTLEFHLHGEGRPSMNWARRLKIALGAARGLAYLHEDCHPKIIHRDIKASNILLDDNFEAKVADFGLAKFAYDTDTHVSTRVMGTFGYLAPEYASSGKLTEKSDVFSFGVVLLELITGCRPIDKGHFFTDDSMVEWARPLLMDALETGKFDGLVDPKLEDYNIAEMAQMVACAAVCVRQSAKRRPHMSQIVRALEGNLSIDDLCKERSPASSTAYKSSDYDHSQQHKHDLEKLRKLALGSQEQSTSEFSAITSDYGALPSTSSTENQNETQDMGSGDPEIDGKDVREIPIL